MVEITSSVGGEDLGKMGWLGGHTGCVDIAVHGRVLGNSC